MNAPDVLARLSAIGVKLSREGDALIAEPRSALTDEARALIRRHKAELLAALARQAETTLTRAAEVRRGRVMAMLEARPDLRYALIVDEEDPAYPGCVVLAVGLRSDAGVIRTCDLIVPQERYDGFALIDLIDRHGCALH